MLVSFYDQLLRLHKNVGLHVHLPLGIFLCFYVPLLDLFSDDCVVWYSIMDREKKLSILYQKRGRATQFSSKAARDKWLQREIDEYERVLSSNLTQVRVSYFTFWSI